MKEILFILVFLGELGYVPGVCWNCLRIVEDIILYESNLHYTSEERNFGEILSLNWCYISPLTNKHLQPTECLQPPLKCTSFGEFLGKTKHFPLKVKKSPFSSVFLNIPAWKLRFWGPTNHLYTWKSENHLNHPPLLLLEVQNVNFYSM